MARHDGSVATALGTQSICSIRAVLGSRVQRGACAHKLAGGESEEQRRGPINPDAIATTPKPAIAATMVSDLLRRPPWPPNTDQ